MTPSRPPRYDPFLYRALRKVARGEIGATGDTDALRHRTDELPLRIVDALATLRRDGYITVRPTAGTSWIRAELSLPGTQLLSAWLTGLHDPVPRISRDLGRFLALRRARRGDVALAADNTFVQSGRPLPAYVQPHLHELIDEGHLRPAEPALFGHRLVSLTTSGEALFTKLHAARQEHAARIRSRPSSPGLPSPQRRRRPGNPRRCWSRR